MAEQPSGAQQSHIFAEEKMGGMRQNKLPKQRGKIALIVIFHRVISSPEAQKALRHIKIYYPDGKSPNERK